MSKLQGEILTLPKMSGSVSAPKSLSGNVGAKTINIGGKGDDGATFIPSVSADGIISWTNDRELPNPEPVNIKGAKGDKGDKGDRGLQGIQGIQGERGEQGLKGDKGDRGEQGVQGVQGAKGETGAQGQKGADGTPATHHWSGTTLYITSASGTSSANLKGEKGDKGDKGDPGTNGKDGADGQPGKDGADGYSPVRGKDYWTDADKAEIVQQTKGAISVPTKTSQLTNDSDFVTLAGIKPTYFIPYYENPTSFGCTNADDLTTIVSTMPNNSNCTFWINATQFPAVYNEIHQFNKKHGLNEAFGCVTLEKRSNVVRVKWECYRNMFTVVNSWTSVNNRGWVGWQVLIPFTA